MALDSYQTSNSVILLCIQFLDIRLVKGSIIFLKGCFFWSHLDVRIQIESNYWFWWKSKKYNSSHRLWPGAPSFRCFSPLLSEGWVEGSLVADSHDERWELWMLDGFNTSVNGFKAGSRRDMTLGGCPQPCVLVIVESLMSLAWTWAEMPCCYQIGFYLGTFDHWRTWHLVEIHPK